MSPTITPPRQGLTAEEREAVQEAILERLCGCNDLAAAIGRSDSRRAEYLGGVYHDYLTLLLRDLGWSLWNGSGRGIDSFSTDDAVLARVFGRLLPDTARDARGFIGKDRAASEKLARRNQLVLRVAGRHPGLGELVGS